MFVTARAFICTPSDTVALGAGFELAYRVMGPDPSAVAELAIIVALSAATVGVAQFRHLEGRIALGVGVTLLLAVFIGQTVIGA